MSFSWRTQIEEEFLVKLACGQVPVVFKQKPYHPHLGPLSPAQQLRVFVAERTIDKNVSGTSLPGYPGSRDLRPFRGLKRAERLYREAPRGAPRGDYPYGDLADGCRWRPFHVEADLIGCYGHLNSRRTSGVEAGWPRDRSQDQCRGKCNSCDYLLPFHFEQSWRGKGIGDCTGVDVGGIGIIVH